jgi:folate-dependent phosphoribosylglycinamide formyltransferase PurN
MRVAMVVNGNLRHKYYANKIIENFEVCGVIETIRDYHMEAKVSGDIPLEYEGEDAELMAWHFDLRKSKEEEYFGGNERIRYEDVPAYVNLHRQHLNSEVACSFIYGLEPDVVLVYGGPLIKTQLLAACPPATINLHAGLSPWYRGAATLFWPLYMQEPEKLGVTLHVINEKVDDGPIIHQHRPTIYADDTQHDIGCRAIVETTECAIQMLKKMEANGEVDLHEVPKVRGEKIWSKWDFRPYHLRVLKFLLDNGMLKEYLDTIDSPMREVKIIEQDGVKYERSGDSSQG